MRKVTVTPVIVLSVLAVLLGGGLFLLITVRGEGYRLLTGS